MKVIKMRPKKKPCCNEEHMFHHEVAEFILKRIVRKEGTSDHTKWSEESHFDFSLGGITQSFCLAFDFEQVGRYEQADKQIEQLKQAYGRFMEMWEDIKSASRTR